MKKSTEKRTKIGFKEKGFRNVISEKTLSSASAGRRNLLTLFEKPKRDVGLIHNDSSTSPKRKTATQKSPNTRNQRAVKTDGLNEIGRLVSHDEKRRTSTGVSVKVKAYIALFLVGLVGTIFVLWTMLDTSSAKRIANDLELQRVANSLENVLSALAYPALMFTVYLMIFACQRLYLLYRQANYLEGATKRKQRRR